jgi:hypothetical protein
MAALSLMVRLSFDTTDCIVCGVKIVLTEELMQQRRRDHAIFFCPNGHQQIFSGETAEEGLRRQLADEKRKLEFARNEIKAHEESAEKAKQEAQKVAQGVAQEMARLKRRIGNGVCPCCQRTVSQLARHMSTEHPDYAGPPIAEGAGTEALTEEKISDAERRRRLRRCGRCNQTGHNRRTCSKPTP